MYLMALNKIDAVNVAHMVSVINKSADWPPPHYHKMAKMFPQIGIS